MKWTYQQKVLQWHLVNKVFFLAYLDFLIFFTDDKLQALLIAIHTFPMNFESSQLRFGIVQCILGKSWKLAVNTWIWWVHPGVKRLSIYLTWSLLRSSFQLSSFSLNRLSPSLLVSPCLLKSLSCWEVCSSFAEISFNSRSLLKRSSSWMTEWKIDSAYWLDITIFSVVVVLSLWSSNSSSPD